MVLFVFASPAAAAVSPFGNEPPSETGATTPAAETSAISIAPAGEEALELSGRFAMDSTTYADAVDWEVKDSWGEVIFNSSAVLASLKLSPGVYRVLANYGNVQIDEAVNVAAETKLSINFVLNAGALRILPRLRGIDGPVPQSTSRIYSLNAGSKGQLVSTSNMPGEILKLAAGTYRIETSFASGNVSTVSDVSVKAGVVTAVNIDHRAALAHFSLALPAGGQVSWKVIGESSAVLSLSGNEAEAVLKPGNYLALATVGGRKMSRNFSVQQGERAEVILAP